MKQMEEGIYRNSDTAILVAGVTNIIIKGSSPTSRISSLGIVF